MIQPPKFKLYTFSFTCHQPGLLALIGAYRKLNPNEADLKGLDSPFRLAVGTQFKGGGNIDWIGNVSLIPMPGCCGVVVSTNLDIDEQFRGAGKYKFLHEATKEVSKSLGYSLLLATIQMSNIPEVKNTLTEHWKYYTCFTNSRTSNLLSLIGYDLACVSEKQFLWEGF